MAKEADGCGCGGDCLPRGMDRREFVKATAAACAGATLGHSAMPLFAGPFDDNDYRRLIPADKKLDPAWVRSLFERGRKQTYANEELTYIGMPVGGIGAGLVYLGGDGRLWMWDVFNKSYSRGFMGRGANGETYLEPFKPLQPFDQGFKLRVTTGDATDTRSLDREGFANVMFDGRYPMGLVTYEDPACAVGVKLEAFSPTIPLDLDNSTYPATVMRYTLTNTSDQAVEAAIGAWVDNPVCLYTGDVTRRNTVRHGEDVTVLACSAESPQADASSEPDRVFEDFEKADYAGWTVTGEAFGEGPMAIADVPDYQGALNAVGRRVVNSHAQAPGDDVDAKDGAVGTLLSGPFKIDRNYIRFRIGGGNKPHHDENTLAVLADAKALARAPEETTVLLWVDGKVARSETGRDSNKMHQAFMRVDDLRGREARLMIVDTARGGWGNIGVDQIVFTNTPPKSDPVDRRHDHGTFAVAAVGGADAANASAGRDDVFAGGEADTMTGPHGRPLIGALGKTVSLQPGQAKTVAFVVAWHFPNLELDKVGRVGRHYTGRFEDAAAAAAHVAASIDSLYEQTHRWVETWYDSTLPYWLLDRAMANTSTLATTVCYLFEDGRFYGWEGVNCCPGTCTHVWHYAQAPGRLFPEVERNLRRRVDFGIGMNDDGGISFRTMRGAGNRTAVDGQCGRILGIYRDHQMSADDALLRELWPKVRMAIEFMLAHDPDRDGILDGAQHNTLDAAWHGQISFTSSLYIAAMRAGERMAREMADDEFADRCKAVADAGGTNILKLYNGEYFYQIEDPNHADEIAAGKGCYIDQVFGQTWSHWTNLGRLFDREKQLTALRSLWKYNFVPDVGPFREHFTRGRWYAKAGDAGLIMCSWPREQVDPVKKKHWQYQYFNECMTGFEYQAAAHMVWEGHDQPDLLQHGLAIARAIHDRYDARLRNPYNEIECSDHYARAMASYGVYQAVCGFNCHGPSGHIEFAPRLTPDDFKAAFTCATGWGSFAQQRRGDHQLASITPRWGRVTVKTFGLRCLGGITGAAVHAEVDGRPIEAAARVREGEARVDFDRPLVLETGQTLTVTLA